MSKKLMTFGWSSIMSEKNQVTTQVRTEVEVGTFLLSNYKK